MKIEEIAGGVLNQLAILIEKHPNDHDLGKAVREELREMCQVRKEMINHDEQIKKMIDEN